MVAQTDAAALELLCFLGAPALHPLVGVLKAVKVVGVHQGKLKFLSTNNHVLAPFLGRAPVLPRRNKLCSRHKRSPFRVWSGDCV